LSKPVLDSILKPVSVCTCKCCERFGFGAVALATRVITFPFPLNVSEKPFTFYSHVPNSVLCAKLQIAQYSQHYMTICLREKIYMYTCIHYWTPPSWFLSFETGLQGLIRTGFANGMRNLMNQKPVLVCQMKYARNRRDDCGSFCVLCMFLVFMDLLSCVESCIFLKLYTMASIKQFKAVFDMICAVSIFFLLSEKHACF